MPADRFFPEPSLQSTRWKHMSHTISSLGSAQPEQPELWEVLQKYVPDKWVDEEGSQE